MKQMRGGTFVVQTRAWAPMVLCVLTALPSARAAAPAPAVPPPTFTAEQVASGQQIYARQCAPCHGAAQEGGEAGPALRGNVFQRKWGGKPWDLYEQTRRTMPVTQPAALPRSQYEDVVALLLSVNGQAPGSARLSASNAPERAFEPRIPDAEWLHHRGNGGSLN